MALARSEGSPQRFYSLSAQIQQEREAYYGILEQTQRHAGHHPMDGVVPDALIAPSRVLRTCSRVLAKARFWHEDRARR